jgi:pimeloyl-ACP methyl ester carboxylesterase
MAKISRQVVVRIRFLATLLLLIMVLATTGPHAASAMSGLPQVAFSKDGTPISYEVHGLGEPTLLFVHGWSCDSRYWRYQIDRFAQHYRVVVLDLAGHGHSGMLRGRYTMQAFGEDVVAVANAINSSRLVLIGHSMGGAVIAEAARLLPGRVIGLIGVDTFDNIEYPLTREELDQMRAPLVTDFPKGSREFVAGMLLPSTDPQIREWILADMSSAPPFVALSALEEMMHQYLTGDAARIFASIAVPVVAVNGDLWPVNVEANKRHMQSFEVITLKDSDHFLMLDRPHLFNQALTEAIHRLQRQVMP